ncbi:hypothetical protein N2P70_17135, partial [Escherichia coli]|nr:hypothetical protein [Escherichia coli]
VVVRSRGFGDGYQGQLLAVVGGLLCVLLLAMVGWKSLYALIMLAGLWLFLPKRKTPENGITT